MVRILQLHAEALRQRFGRRVLDDVGLVAEELPERLVRLLLRLVDHRRDLGHGHQIALDLVAFLLRHVALEKNGHLDLLRLQRQRAVDRERRDENRADKIHRHDDDQDGGDGDEEVALEVCRGFFGDVLEVDGSHYSSLA